MGCPICGNCLPPGLAVAMAWVDALAVEVTVDFLLMGRGEEGYSVLSGLMVRGLASVTPCSPLFSLFFALFAVFARVVPGGDLSGLT